jgi:hypothetical protein
VRRHHGRQRREDVFHAARCFFSHSRINALICLRWRFSCEPHRSHGMIGNCFTSAAPAPLLKLSPKRFWRHNFPPAGDDGSPRLMSMADEKPRSRAYCRSNYSLVNFREIHKGNLCDHECNLVAQQ